MISTHHGQPIRVSSDIRKKKRLINHVIVVGAILNFRVKDNAGFSTPSLVNPANVAIMKSLDVDLRGNRLESHQKNENESCNGIAS